MRANVGSFLHDRAREEPNRTAIIDAGRNDLVMSYAELDANTRAVAAFLRERGIGAGDRVAICTNDGLDFVGAWFGAAYAGCTTLPIPSTSTAREIAFRLDHAGCKALLFDTSRKPVSDDARARARGRVVAISVEDAIAGNDDATPHELSEDALAMLLYTSGTTGAAKAVCVTHGSLRAHTRALADETLQLGESDRVLGTLPLTHSYGIRSTLLVPFYAGASTVLVPRFSPSRTLELCARHGVTWIPGVPTMFVAWADVPDAPSLPSLRWSMSAGAPLNEEVRLRAEASLGAPVRQAYGLTEANLTAINAPPDGAVAGSCGKPVADVEVRISNGDGGSVPVGMHGEVLVRGQNVMAGYLDDMLATAHALRDGWLHTGDIGFLDDDGRLTIVDRKKDLILRGGASVYPSELEAVLGRHPAVRDVAVVGQTDPYYGEEVVAIIVASADVSGDALDAWARERLASYKVPRRYGFVDALPRGGSGKTLKRRLRDRLASGRIETVEPSTDGSGK